MKIFSKKITKCIYFPVKIGKNIYMEILVKLLLIIFFKNLSF